MSDSKAVINFPKITETSDFSKSNIERNVTVFRNILDRLEILARSEGLNLKAYEDEKLPLFSRLDFAEQKSILQNVDKYLSLLEASKREDLYVLSNPKTLWRFLGLVKLRACDDLFSSIERNDVLEVYDLQGRQIYRSFNFFRICSYTLEEVYSVPWTELYERDDRLMAANQAAVQKLFAHPEYGTHNPEIPVHEVREIKRVKQRTTLIQPRVVSPLFDSMGRPAGFVNAFIPIERDSRALPRNNN